MSNPEPSSHKVLTRFNKARVMHVFREHEAYVLRKPGGKRADLRFWDLREGAFSGMRLDEIELTGANLSGCRCRDTVFNSASLNCALIENSDFTNASLRRTDLRGALVMGACFNGADLTGADFRRAAVGYIAKDGAWSEIRNVNESFSVEFRNCSMKGARFDEANLKDANFAGANLAGASFAGATLGNANFDGAILMGVRIDQLRIAPERLKSAIFDPGPEHHGGLAALLARIADYEAFIASEGRRGAMAAFEKEDLRLAREAFAGRRLTGIRLSGARAIGVDFSHCELQGARFDGADLRDAKFNGTDLRGASFAGARLSHADLTGANLGDLVLASGRRVVTDLTGAELSGTRLQPQPTPAA